MCKIIAFFSLIATLLQFGCAPQSSSQVAEPTRGSIPLLALEHADIAIDHFGDRDFVTCSQLAQYVDKYGIGGWIMGLSDERLVMEPQGGSHGSSGGGRALELRNKDMFYIYYLQTHPDVFSNINIMTSSYVQRDIEILRVKKYLTNGPKMGQEQSRSAHPL